MADKGFEGSMTELENIVKQLEKGDVTLDESLKLFENGIKLAGKCREMLENAEKKVSVLVSGNSGELEKQDFLAEEE